MSAPYFLIDTDTTNLVGSYRSEEAALRAVVDAANRYGRNSAEVTSLALLRDDVPEQEACVAKGRALAALALGRYGDRSKDSRKGGRLGEKYASAQRRSPEAPRQA